MNSLATTHIGFLFPLRNDLAASFSGNGWEKIASRRNLSFLDQLLLWEKFLVKGGKAMPLGKKRRGFYSLNVTARVLSNNRNNGVRKRRFGASPYAIRLPDLFRLILCLMSQLRVFCLHSAVTFYIPLFHVSRET